MKYLIGFVTSVLAVVVMTDVVKTQQASNAWTGAFTFVQISDVHLGHTKYVANQVTDLQTSLYDEAIRQIENLRPKPLFVVVTGDLVDGVGSDAEGKPYWLKEFPEFVSHSKAFTIPLYLVPGNHDVSSNSDAGTVTDYLTQIKVLNSTQRDYYSFNRRGCHFVVLNATEFVTHDGSMKGLKDAQLRWLETDLSSVAAKSATHIVVFMHQPPFEHSASEEDGEYGHSDRAGENTFDQDRAGMLTLLAEAGVKSVFAGHLHENAVGYAGKLSVTTTSSLSPQTGPGRMKVRPDDCPGFRVVTVNHDSIASEYKRLYAGTQSCVQP